MAWNIPLVSLGQLSQFCPLSIPCAISAPLTGSPAQESEKLKCHWLCAALLSNDKNTGVLPILFSFIQQHSIIFQHSIVPDTMKAISLDPAETRIHRLNTYNISSDIYPLSNENKNKGKCADSRRPSCCA